MEQTLPDNHPDMLRILQAVRHDIAPPAAAGERPNSLANALTAALGKRPGDEEDLANSDFLVHVLSVNRAAGEIDDETFAVLLQRLQTRAGRSELTALFTAELESEHGYADELGDEPDDEQPDDGAR